MYIHRSIDISTHRAIDRCVHPCVDTCIDTDTDEDEDLDLDLCVYIYIYASMTVFAAAKKAPAQTWFRYHPYRSSIIVLCTVALSPISTKINTVVVAGCGGDGGGSENGAHWRTIEVVTLAGAEPRLYGSLGRQPEIQNILATPKLRCVLLSHGKML